MPRCLPCLCFALFLAVGCQSSGRHGAYEDDPLVMDKKPAEATADKKPAPSPLLASAEPTPPPLPVSALAKGPRLYPRPIDHEGPRELMPNNERAPLNAVPVGRSRE